MKTLDAVRTITEAAPDTETRVARRAEIGTCVAHQGDVYVHRVADDHPRGRRLETRQLARGTTQGSRHVAEGEVEVYEGAEFPPTVDARFPRDCLGPVVVAPQGWRMPHPEHTDHEMPAGTYQVTYQLDVSTQRRVAD